ncbi:MAG: hypothetical protein KJ915_06785 [Candidatus Omnitrophica bacterium]|nr:hypothetical protein [Candidatus Omnitrophota bacterium]
MPNDFDWLPDLVFYDTYADWDKYLDALYAFYKTDFLDSKPKFRDKDISVKRLPLYQDKESNFWHLIQEAYETKREEDRIPDFRRCERIRWPRPVIENENNPVILVWENKRYSRKGIEHNICLWLKEKEYLVILRKRKHYILLWTAYPVTNDHQKNKLQKEYDTYK